MNKIFFLLLLNLLSIKVYGQIVHLNGYFVLLVDKKPFSADKDVSYRAQSTILYFTSLPKDYFLSKSYSSKLVTQAASPIDVNTYINYLNESNSDSALVKLHKVLSKLDSNLICSDSLTRIQNESFFYSIPSAVRAYEGNKAIIFKVKMDALSFGYTSIQNCPTDDIHCKGKIIRIPLYLLLCNPSDKTEYLYSIIW